MYTCCRKVLKNWLSCPKISTAHFHPDEQHIRHCMLYEFRKGNKAAVATRNINTLYPNSLDVCKCQRWFLKFRSGNVDLHNAPRSGRPLTIDVDILRSIVDENLRQTIAEIASTIGVQKIGKIWRAGRWVPLLSEEDKVERTLICSSLLIKQEKDSFLNRLITCGEKWVLYDNPREEGQRVSSAQTIKVAPKCNGRAKKVLLCVWWNIHGVVHFGLLNFAEISNTSFYCNQLSHLNKVISEKYPILSDKRGVILQQDSTKSHIAKVILEKVRDLGWDMIAHPPYSPDLTPSDYHLFRSMQYYLEGRKYKTYDDVRVGVFQFFNSKSEDFYREGIVKLILKWKGVIANDGDYLIE